MSNSALVTYTRLSPNCTSPRNHKIDTITIHCTAGHKENTAQQIASGSRFTTADSKSGASCNYAIGGDGSIALIVDEGDRSWCTSNKANDHRAVTIEVASNTAGTEVTDAAYNALLELVADICQRNGIKPLVWSEDKAKRVAHADGCNMTVHRDYANKACPGEYLYSRHGAIAAAVNEKLEDDNMTQAEKYAEFKYFLTKYRAEVCQQSASMPELLEQAKEMGLTDGSRPRDTVTREEAAIMARAAALYGNK
jgi:hypothetical protein